MTESDYVPLNFSTGGNAEYTGTSGMGHYWFRMKAREPEAMIIVERSGYANPQFTWRAKYGDRFVLGADADAALYRAWATWGGDVPAIVYA